VEPRGWQQHSSSTIRARCVVNSGTQSRQKWGPFWPEHPGRERRTDDRAHGSLSGNSARPVAQRWHVGQDERDLLDILKMGRVAVQNATAEQLPDEKQAGRRVLIVDHDENVLIALKRLLEEARYNTTTAQGGLKALQLLRQGVFDLVLLDDHLPDVSGEEVVRQVRSASAGTPVVVVQSGTPSDDLTVRYAHLGACFFINRRDPEAIAELVHDYLSRTRFLCARFLKADPES
jgi:CheY-like chemotaxis protein